MEQHRLTNRLNHRMTLRDPDSLRKDAKLLLLISALFTIAVALSNTFVNVYLWKLQKDFIVIGRFNLFQYIAMMATFIVAGRLAKNLDRVLLLRFGVMVLAIFYLVVLWLSKESVHYIVILGTILGIGQGFYWFSFNMLYFEITEPNTRDVFNGMNGLYTSISGIIAPFLSGWFLSHQTGVTGYRTIFIISLLVFLLAIITSFFFYKRSFKGDYRLKEVLSESIYQKKWRNILLGMMAQGGREGVIIFLVGLLVYISTNNEFSLGTYSMAISAVSLVTYFSVGKWIKKNWRKRSMMIGSIMMALVVVPMFIDTNYITLFIYGIGTSIFAPLYFIPLTSIVFDLIGETEDTAELRGEYIVLREIGLNMGRIFITLIFIYFVKIIGSDHLRFLLLFSGSLQVVTWYFIKSVQTND